MSTCSVRATPGYCTEEAAWRISSTCPCESSDLACQSCHDELVEYHKFIEVAAEGMGLASTCRGCGQAFSIEWSPL